MVGMYAGFHIDVNAAFFVCFFHLMQFFFDFLYIILFFPSKMVCSNWYQPEDPEKLTKFINRSFLHLEWEGV